MADFGRFPGRAARHPLSPHLLHPHLRQPKRNFGQEDFGLSFVSCNLFRTQLSQLFSRILLDIVPTYIFPHPSCTVKNSWPVLAGPWRRPLQKGKRYQPYWEEHSSETILEREYALFSRGLGISGRTKPGNSELLRERFRGGVFPDLFWERKKPINIKNFGGTPLSVPGTRPICPVIWPVCPGDVLSL